MYDVIVVGARVGGSPTAMLLARKGYKVLLVDRAQFPSDTVSTHMLQPRGVARLKRWGLYERVAASGVPEINSIAFDFGGLVLEGTPPPYDGTSTILCPRRSTFDSILVDAAVEAGVEFRPGFTVTGLVFENGRVAGLRGNVDGKDYEERAAIVVGADGRHSAVAKFVDAKKYRERPVMSCAYYSYWSGLPAGERPTLYARPGVYIGVLPSNDDRTIVFVQWSVREFDRVRRDIEGEFQKAIAQVPDLAERMGTARREERFIGTVDLPNFFRVPFGNGWALVGDAGYVRDATLGQGMSDAFRDAEFLVEAIDDTLQGQETPEQAFGRYQNRRDEAADDMYELVCQLATMEPLPAEIAAVFEAIADDPDQVSLFLGAHVGTIPVSDFYSPKNFAPILERIAQGRTESIAA